MYLDNQKGKTMTFDQWRKELVFLVLADAWITTLMTFREGDLNSFMPENKVLLECYHQGQSIEQVCEHIVAASRETR